MTASWVGFHGDERLYVSLLFFSDWNLYPTGYRIGDGAKDLFHLNPKNTIFDVKRLIGRTIEEVKRDFKHLPFKVEERNGAPMIIVEYKDEIREFVCSICQLLSFRPFILSSQ
jgi:molecular chaperone DnaK (HSP70)